MGGPLIGVSGRCKRARDVAGFPASMGDVELDVYVVAYARAVSAAGGLPVHLPQHIDPAAYADRLDGVLLTGGADVDPARYGAIAGPDVHRPEPVRDDVELALVDLAASREIPVLGICRGLQLLNVWGGGTLHQHVPQHARLDEAPDALVDEVTFTAGSRLAGLYGERLSVNSLHHQTVDAIAPGWSASGRASDGSVEALEWPGHDVLAVQWHPELLPGAATDPLFRWLVDAAAVRAGG